MEIIINLIRKTITSLRRAYYSRIVFSKTQFNRHAVIIGPDVCKNFRVAHAENLSIGDGTVLNGDCYINAQGGIRIGRYCHIGKGLTVLSSNHNFKSDTRIPYDEQDVRKAVEIGDAVWIGANVCISPGSRIGDGAIIALGAVVRGQIEPCAIVAGNPGKVIGWRDKITFDRLHREGSFA